MKTMLNLNKQQQTAVAHTNGPMMVLAGPGSGKTAVITARATNLINSGVRPGNILIITYSKAAAQEMEARFKRFYNHGEAPPVNFGTFHSTFFRILRRKSNYSVEQIFSESDLRILIRSYLVSMDYDIDEDFVSSVIGEMSLVRNELHDINHYHSVTIGATHFRELLDMYNAHKAEHNLIDFDDMLCKTYDILKTHESELKYWQNRYTYIMIDEFQDINCVQYEAVRLLAANYNNLFIVGDDDQSIYRFRGARPEFLLNFPQDFPGCAQVTLSTNYRSTNAIISYANSLISHNTLRYNKHIVGTGTPGTQPIVLTANDQNHEAIEIAEKIRNLAKHGTDLSDIAVAYRLNIQARALTDAFLNMNIPFKTRDEVPSIYDHWVAEDIFAYLRLARRLCLRQKYGHDPDATRIINKPFRYISKAFLQSLRKEDQDLFRTYGSSPFLHMATKSTIESLHHDLIKLAGLETADAIRFIRQTLGYNTHIIEACEYRKLRPAGLFELADELQEAAKAFPKPLEFIAHAAQAAEQAKQTPTGPCCTLTTLHSAKGLEFAHMFIVGVIEDLIPSARSKTLTEIEEERRLFYVGVTRAKSQLYISTIKSRYDKPTTPSRFLDETINMA